MSAAHRIDVSAIGFMDSQEIATGILSLTRRASSAGTRASDGGWRVA
jgi:hypothetical protein